VAARKFLESVGIPLNKKPINLKDDEIVRIVEGMKVFKRFRSPDANCLSTLGSDFIKAGIEREFNPDFIVVGTQNPSSYSGHPFKVEVAIAYGGKIPKRTVGLLYRFANKIPLLYDEASDVSWKIIHTMINWRNYGVDINEDPIAVFVYLYSTRIPYKTVGKEYIADRSEIEREILSAMRSVCRKLRSYLLEKQKAERKEKRLGLYSKYLSRIAKYSTELARKEVEPDIAPLLRRIERTH
jgi:DNA topoisomerase-6 subunit B